jgi:acetyl-CoA carboxylase carboxyltransferase component
VPYGYKPLKVYFNLKNQKMPLQKKIQELKKRRELVQMGGGEKAIEKQIALGKLTARERIVKLLDDN